ncbi:hypothetical protein NE237_022332 [Protea cynaroides]|uniref:Uncharacterized protein n=1 Tax=Protea cynaroides TaxID=273540 RepID=A0A9Q0HCV4_9MAGN|nr:hypothetical protein NE237_022332 [Protea cynaroides]
MKGPRRIKGLRYSRLLPRIYGRFKKRKKLPKRVRKTRTSDSVWVGQVSQPAGHHEGSLDGNSDLSILQSAIGSRLTLFNPGVFHPNPKKTASPIESSPSLFDVRSQIPVDLEIPCSEHLIQPLGCPSSLLDRAPSIPDPTPSCHLPSTELENLLLYYPLSSPLSSSRSAVYLYCPFRRPLQRLGGIDHVEQALVTFIDSTSSEASDFSSFSPEPSGVGLSPPSVEPIPLATKPATGFSDAKDGLSSEDSGMLGPMWLCAPNLWMMMTKNHSTLA